MPRSCVASAFVQREKNRLSLAQHCVSIVDCLFYFHVLQKKNVQTTESHRYIKSFCARMQWSQTRIHCIPSKRSEQLGTRGSALFDLSHPHLHFSAHFRPTQSRVISTRKYIHLQMSHLCYSITTIPERNRNDSELLLTIF